MAVGEAARDHGVPRAGGATDGREDVFLTRGVDLLLDRGRQQRAG